MSKSGDTAAANDLAGLYRRYARGSDAALPEADALIALAEGEHPDRHERLLADVARSSLHADLLRFTRALAPESARLAVQLEETLETSAAAHARNRSMPRRAQARRGGLRLAASLAAGLIVAVAVWTLQRHDSVPAPAAQTAAATHPGQDDRIFAALDVRAAKSDEIFHGGFHGDRIFDGRFNGGG